MTDSNNIQTDRNSTTHWHRLLGKALEVSLTPLNISVQTEIDVVSGSPKADIVLLRREGEEWTEEQKTWLADGLRDTNAKEELLSFKFTESLTEDAISHLFVCGHLYRSKQKLKPGNLQCFLLLSKTPNTDIMQRYGFEQTDKAGVYAASFPMLVSMRIILLNELKNEPHNAVLKYFASKQQEWKDAFACMEPRWLLEAPADFRIITMGIWSIRMKQSIEDVDLVGLTPEHVMGLGRGLFESVMNSLSDEELFKFRRTADIQQKGEQKGRQEGEQKGRQEGEAKILVRQLTRRFGELPAAVHEQIAIADSDALERWGDLVLDARSLKDVFGPNLPEVH